MKTKLRYYVIFTITIWNGKNTRQFRPAIVKRPLFWPSDVEINDGIISRKYCGVLTFAQLIQFLNEVDFDDTSHTMGSISEYGHLDAVSFERSDESYYTGASANLIAYVSVLYDDELQLADTLTEEKIEMVWDHTDKVMKWLKDDAIDNAWDIKKEKLHIPWLNEYYFDFDQLTI